MVTNNSEVKDIFNALKMKVNNIIKISTLSNFLLKVETSEGNYYLKVYNNKEEGKIGYKLAHLYPFLSKNNIPVPRVLRFDESLSLIRYPYLIISEVEGKMLCDSINKMNNGEIHSFYYELGKIIAKIHSITFDKFGETFNGITVESFSEIGHKGPFNYWKEMHKEIINHRLSYFRGTYFKNLIQPIKLYFRNYIYLIDYDIIPRLLHIDLNQKNIFLKKNKISGIIDFDGSFIGHNEEELMRTECAHFSNNENFKAPFFRGYTEIVKLDNNYEQRRIFYYLSRLLVHIDCIIKYGDNYIKNIKKEQKIVKNEITKILTGKAINFDKNKPNA